MSDNIAVMNAGRFEQVGSAQDLYYRPDTAFVAGFVGDSNRWSGKVVKQDGDNTLIQTTSGLTLRGATQGRSLSQGDTIDAFVRPEAIRIAHNAEDLASFDNQISGTVTSILFNGAASRVMVRDTEGHEEVAVNLPQSGEFANLTKGAPVHIGWASDQANCFSAGAS